MRHEREPTPRAPTSPASPTPRASAGTAYYVTVTANASTGYLASAASTTAGPQNATSQVNAPGTPTVASSTTTAGAITATFSALDRRRAGELHRDGVHQRRHDDRLRHPGELHLGRPAHRAHPGHELLRPDHRGAGATGYLSATSAVSASSGVGDDPARDAQHAGPRATARPRARSRSPPPSSNAPGGETYTVTACTNAGMTTGCVTSSSFTSGSTLRARLHPGLRRHQLLRDRDGERRRAATWPLRPRPSAGRTPTRARWRPGHPDGRGVDDDRRRDHRHVHGLDRRRTGELHRDRLHQRGHDDRVRHPDELHLGRPAHRAHRRARATTSRSPRSPRRATSRRPRRSRPARPPRRPSSPPPTITGVTSSTTTAGQLTITFTGRRTRQAASSTRPRPAPTPR